MSIAGRWYHHPTTVAWQKQTYIDTRQVNPTNQRTQIGLHSEVKCSRELPVHKIHSSMSLTCRSVSYFSKSRLRVILYNCKKILFRTKWDLVIVYLIIRWTHSFIGLIREKGVSEQWQFYNSVSESLRNLISCVCVGHWNPSLFIKSSAAFVAFPKLAGGGVWNHILFSLKDPADICIHLSFLSWFCRAVMTKIDPFWCCSKSLFLSRQGVLHQFIIFYLVKVYYQWPGLDFYWLFGASMALLYSKFNFSEGFQLLSDKIVDNLLFIVSFSSCPDGLE